MEGGVHAMAMTEQNWAWMMAVKQHWEGGVGALEVHGR
jgi:hypothetical protein